MVANSASRTILPLEPSSRLQLLVPLAPLPDKTNNDRINVTRLQILIAQMDTNDLLHQSQLLNVDYCHRGDVSDVLYVFRIKSPEDSSEYPVMYTLKNCFIAYGWMLRTEPASNADSGDESQSCS